MFQDKKKEIENKIRFSIACEKQNSADMQEYSEKIFGTISEENFEYAKKILAGKPQKLLEDEFLTEEEIEKFIEKFNHIYGIKLQVQFAPIVSRCMMKGEIFFVNNGAKI